MGRILDCVDSFEEVKPDALISFSVICRPRSGATFEDFHTKLTLKTVKDFLPTEETRTKVADYLKRRGFDIFVENQSPVVCGRGSAKLFQSVFRIELLTRLRQVKRPNSKYTVSSVVRRDPSVRIVPPPDMDGALSVVIAERPLFVTPEIPGETKGFELHLPGDIAQMTRASAAHRQAVTGARATGGGVPVAIIDTGFAAHPYYKDHAYRITRIAAADASDPGYDDEPHGTPILANLFACAPDVEAYAIKTGNNIVLALARALNLTPMPRVMSLSFVDDLTGFPALPDELLPLKVAILQAVAGGVTVVAASGDGQNQTFPAMMPEVISVGGVQVKENHDALSLWPSSSNFTSVIYPGRVVPDLCGIASNMWLPIPPVETKGPYDWDPSAGGTSAATPQIAGVCALLLQKNSALSPTDVASKLIQSARPIGPGAGAGLVDGLEAWNLA
jgi:hypothetical protein